MNSVDHPAVAAPVHVTTLDEVRADPATRVAAAGRVWSRPAPAFGVHITQDGETAVVHAGAEQRTADRFRAVLHDQLLYGFHSLHAVLSRDHVFRCQNITGSDYLIDHHVATMPPEHYRIPVLSRGEAGVFVSYERLRDHPPRVIEEPVTFLTPLEPENWGLWLLHGLPAIHDHVRNGRPGRLMCYLGLPWHKTLMRLMGVDPDAVIAQESWTTYRLRQVTLEPYSVVDFVPFAQDRAVYAELAARARHGVADRHRPRLFVTRAQKSGGVRTMRSEQALIAALEPFGFSVIAPETLSFEEQVAAFSRAEVVIGPGGAAMFNTVFCKAGTKVLTIEGTTAFVHNHSNLFAGLGHDYAVIVGEDERAAGRYPHNPWTVDVDRAMAHIRRWL